MPNKRAKGQIIVELMVALGVLSIGLVGAFALFSQSIGINRVISDNYTAMYLAAEGIEIVRNIVSKDSIEIAGGTVSADTWADGLSNGEYEAGYNDDILTQLSSDPRPLYFSPSTKLYSYDSSGEPTVFTRVITIALKNNPLPGTPNEMQVNSLVRWTTRGGGNYDLELEDHFFNWVPPKSESVPL